jgi:signal transduction histidine kinase/ActR/RegA family two-component response regulator
MLNHSDRAAPDSGGDADRRYRDLQNRLVALVGASSTLFGSPKLDDVMAGILTLADALMPADGYAIWRLDPITPVWRIGASRGISDRFAQRMVHSFGGEPATTITFSEPIVAEDIVHSPMLGERLNAYRDEGVQSVLAVPLQIAGRGTGTLVFYYRERRGFDKLDVQAAQALGSLSAAAVTTAELYDAQQRSRESAEHNKRRAEFLAQASAALASSLDYEATLRTVAQLAVPDIADWCAVDVVDDRHELRRVAVAHVDPRKVELARTLQERYPADQNEPNSVRTAIQSGQPVLVSDVDDAMIVRAARNPEHLEAIRALSITSYICVPLGVRGRTLGAISFVSAESKRRYTSADLDFAQDVAYRCALAVENARVYSHANAANRAKDEFLATLSHELRTPLNAVLGWTRMLRSGTVPPAKVPRALEVIEQNANAQVRLVEDLLDLSRIITGKFRLDAQTVHLAASVEAAAAAIQPAATAKNIMVEVGIDADVPPVYGDPQRLQQAVWNLLSNAVKFTPNGGRVNAELRSEAGHIVVSITDTGEGIPRDVLPFVFDRFRQADSGTTRSHMGLGLGLAIVRHIIELHGGRVNVTSDGPGRGATFRLTLPAAASTPERAALPLRQTAGAHAAAIGNADTAGRAIAGLRVLVVDDDPDTVQLLAELLGQREVVVRVSGSVEQAVAELARETPDLIISDIAMPGRDGYDLLKHVRTQVAPSLPVLAVSAYARVEDRARSAHAGFAAHVAKPLDIDELLVAMAAATGRTPPSGV